MTDVAQTGTKAISGFLNNPAVLDKFKNILGEKAQGFISAVLTIVNQSDKLQNAEPTSIYTAALLAASLDLPINPNFGFAYIVPYWNGKTKKQEAQFQIGYKGLRQLAMRSNQFKKMIARVVMEDQVISTSTIEGVEFDFSKNESKVIAGYVSYFELVNGYTSIHFIKKEQAEAHAKKYSETYKKGFGKWVDDFDKMALKTAVKLHLNSGEAPLSIEMQNAVIADQAVIKNVETMEVEYVDNTGGMTIEQTNAEAQRKSIMSYISKCEDLELLESIEMSIDINDNEIVTVYNTKKNELLEKQLQIQNGEDGK